MAAGARCVLLAACLLAACHQHVGASTLMLCGGYVSDANAEIWNKIVALAGGRGVARVGFLTAASGQPITQGREYKALFESYGVAEAYWIPIHPNNLGAANDKSVVENIKRMTGFFFGGGVQQRYIEQLLSKDRSPSLALAAIRSMYDNGTVVTGTSAGAMVMPSVFTMVDGTSYGALRSGALGVGEGVTAQDLIYDTKGGLGLIGGHVVDSHFHERGRQGRLIRLLSDTREKPLGTNYGIGIDEETALLVTDVGTSEEQGLVIGQAGVFYADVSKSYVDVRASSWRILNVYAHYATAGDIIDLQTHTVTFSKQKMLIKGNETADYAVISQDIFQGTVTGSVSEFRRVADGLFNSRFDSLTYGLTAEVDPLYYVILTEDSMSKGYLEVDLNKFKLGYSDMKLEIRPFEEEN